MSDISRGEGWWIASDGKWYAPELHPDYVAPSAAAAEEPSDPAASSGPPIQEAQQRWAPPVNPVPAGQEVQVPPPVSTVPAASPAPVEQVGSGSAAARWVPFGLVMLVVLGGLAFLGASILDSGSALGSDTPEDAFAGMVAAMNEEDALAIASYMDPQEFSAVTGALERLEADGVDLRGLPGGFDLFMHGLGGPGSPIEASFAPLGPEGAGLSVVRVHGMEMGLVRASDDSFAVVAYQPSQVYALSADEIDVGSRVEMRLRDTGAGIEMTGDGTVNGEPLGRVTERADGLPLELVMIEHDGKWFTSMSYTVVNLAVQAEVVPEPEYGRWRQVLDSGEGGAATPVGAVTRLVEALPALDIEEAILATDPVEARLLHDYMQVIRREADEAVQEALADGSIEILELDLSEKIEGDTAEVYIDRIAFRVTDEYGDETTIEFDRSWCLFIDDDGGRSGGCLDEVLDEAQEVFDEATSGTALAVDLRDLIPERPLVVTTERNGRWYVSPLATIVAYGRELEPLMTDVADEIGRQIGSDAGLVVAEQAVLDGSVEIGVAAGDTVAVALTPDRADFGAGGTRPDLAFQAVTVSATGPVVVQHNVENDWDDEVLRTFRVFADESQQLVVYADLANEPYSNGLVVHNRGDDDAQVTVEVRRIEVVEIDGRDAYSGRFDDEGTPIIVSAGDYSSMVAEGAGLTAGSFERLPWIELRPTSRVDDVSWVAVSGEPGAGFTVRSGE